MPSARTVLTLLHSLDDLFRHIVTAPADWGEEELASWASEALDSADLDRDAARYVRRALTKARRLHRYWLDRPADPDDWHMRVDEALGSRGWEPSLQLARWGLERDPDPELFEEVRVRFRWVHFTEWIDGVTYEDWIAGGPGKR